MSLLDRMSLVEYTALWVLWALVAEYHLCLDLDRRQNNILDRSDYYFIGDAMHYACIYYDACAPTRRYIN